jgi:hypothetical protein
VPFDLQEDAMNKKIKALVSSLGVALLLSGPAWSQAQQAPAAAKSPTTLDSMTLEELDTVVVNAKRFEDRLFEGEQQFYRRYNQLNAQNDLDVNCNVWLSDPNYRGAAAAPDRRYCCRISWPGVLRCIRRTSGVGAARTAGYLAPCPSTPSRISGAGWP